MNNTMLEDTRLEPPEDEDVPFCCICKTTEGLDKIGYNRYMCGDCRLDWESDYNV